MSDQRIEELEREVAKLQEFRDDILPVIKDLWKREIRETGGGTIHSSLAQFCMKYFAGETIVL